jgi:hypothetical protein
VRVAEAVAVCDAAVRDAVAERPGETLSEAVAARTTPPPEAVADLAGETASDAAR